MAENNTTQEQAQAPITERDVLRSLLESQDGYLQIDSANFMTPEMGDIFEGDLASEAMRTIEKTLKSDEDSAGLNANYYVEDPHSEIPRYYPEARVFIVRSKPIINKEAYDLNQFDGDTVYFSMKDISDGGSFTIDNKDYKSFLQYAKINTSDSGYMKGQFGVRCLGINAPEIPHYTPVPIVIGSNGIPVVVTKKFLISEIKSGKAGNADFNYDKYRNRISDQAEFLLMSEKDKPEVWSEIIDNDYKPNNNEPLNQEDYTDVASYQKYYLIVTKDDSADNDPEYHQQGMAAKTTMRDLLASAKDVVLMLDAVAVNHRPTNLNGSYDQDFFVNPENITKDPFQGIKNLWDMAFGANTYKYAGFNCFGQDSYRRFLGAIYIKKEIPELQQDKWINVAKYLKSLYPKIEVLPSYTGSPTVDSNYNYVSNAFKMWTYDNKNFALMDSLTEVSKEDFDDRRAIQKQICGADFEVMKDYTMMIGDCLFMVPPTSIRVVTQTTSERMPLLRSKGSMAKSAQRSERLIEMSLYFNNDGGINGIPYTTELPMVDEKGNKKKATYHMNGLRSLIAMFKLTPFLPIENTYINETLNIEAVSLVNIQISTMPGYPRTMAATLTLEEFNYRIYMPEIPEPNAEAGESLNKNLFSSTISYKLMRYYYQRLLQNGEKIKYLDFNSQDYIEATFGSKTALQPMRFESSNIEFYVADEEHLKILQQIKRASASRPIGTVADTSIDTDVNSEARKWIDQVGYLYGKVKSLIEEEAFKKMLVEALKHDDPEKGYFTAVVESAGTIIDRNDLSKLDSTVLYKTSSIENQIPAYFDETYLQKFADPLVYYLTNNLVGKAPLVTAIKMTEQRKEINEKVGTVSWTFEFKLDRTSAPNDNELALYFNQIQVEINDGEPVTSNIVANMLEDNTLSVSFKCTYDRENTVEKTVAWIFSADATIPKVVSPFILDTDTNKYKFFNICYMLSGLAAEDSGFDESDSSALEATPSAEIDSYLEELKQSIDKESLASMKFIKYFDKSMADVKVKNIAAVMGNTLTKMSLKAVDGFAPQYTGGQDTVIELTLETKDENAVLLLNQLPLKAASYVRNYRQVLNCWPIRLNSEFTRMLGVNEVLIESVDCSTVPSHPGLFTINIKLISVDRTTRNREALKKLEVDSNAGSTAHTATNLMQSKTYFDLKNTLAAAEIYPDLELPTIEEMEKETGYKLIRYSTTFNNRIYPDPDFYFVYGHIYSSQIFRRTIKKFLSDPENVKKMTMKLADKEYGSSLEINPAENLAFQVVKGSANKSQEIIEQTIYDVDKLTYNANKVQLFNSILLTPEESQEYQQELTAATMYSGWNVTENIRCLFREPRYCNATDTKNKLIQDEITKVSDDVVKLIDEILKQPIQFKFHAIGQGGHLIKNAPLEGRDSDQFFKIVVNSDEKQQYYIKECLKDFAKDYFDSDDSPGKKIIQALKVPDMDTYTIIDNMEKLLYAAAAASSGMKEYSDEEDESWKPQLYIKNRTEDGKVIPYCKIFQPEQKTNGDYFAQTMADAMEKGSEFGMFQIKKMLKQDAQNVIGTEQQIIIKDKYVFLDPYYGNHDGTTPEDEIIKYKEYILSDPYCAAEAFMRNTLVWLKKLIQDKVMISLADVVFHLAAESMYDTEMLQKILGRSDIEALDGAVGDISETLEEDFKNIVSMAREAVSLGKIFLPVMMAVTKGDEALYSNIRTQNIPLLDSMTQSVTVPSFGETSEGKRLFRKLILALVGSDLTKSSTRIGVAGYSSNRDIVKKYERVYLAAAENPSVYMMHSFYDMLVNDKRGRMARAFPTFYMMFLDEGREIGLWKLHDNFYNMSAISEIEITKSRKIAADTARIVMSNMFKTYTTDDEDIKPDSNFYTLRDAFNSIFSPRQYFLEQEAKRMLTRPVDRVKLQPGIRIHIRMGYSANAADLPILFNGTVAEVGPGEAIEIVAQGDGIELMNPIMLNTDSEDVQNETDFVLFKWLDNWVTNGETPMGILSSMLTYKGGWTKKIINKYTNGRFFNDNAFGIIHFGEPDYNLIFKNGECVQNIYEATSRVAWAESDNYSSEVARLYETDGAPKLSTQLFGKTFWDIMHICASVAPDFITSIVPFGMRSSIFYGAPRYYYAYDYVRDKDGVVKEKRKPFQQYHLYTSYHDIIQNNIIASERDVRTCATGMYSGKGFWFNTTPKKVGPMWVDFDIYPEKQKTMVVDTQLIAKGSAVGDVIPFIDWYKDKFDSADNGGGYEMAWRMTASALKNSVKDMYQGELIVIGDPSVKPYDKMHIEDLYEDMSGMCEVEAVVHSFNGQTGYTTSIFADCIATIDDRHEQICKLFGQEVLAKAGALSIATILTSMSFAQSTRPMMTALSRYVRKGGVMGKNFINTIGQIIGQDELIKNEKFLPAMDNVSKLFGVTPQGARYYDYIARIRSTVDRLSDISFKDIKTLEQLGDQYGQISKALKNVNPAELEELMSSSTFKGNKDKAVKEALEELKGVTNSFNSSVSSIDIDKAELKKIADAVRGKENLTDDVKNALTKLDKLIAKNTVSTVDDLDEVAGIFKAISTHVDDITIAKDLVTKGDDVLKAATSGIKAVDAIRDSTKVSKAGKILSAAAKLTATSALTSVLLEFGISYIITKNVTEFITRKIRNYQVLQIFPLMKAGRAMTAGLDGTKGVVVGSPSYEQQGVIDGWIDYVFHENHEGFWGGALDIVREMFATEEMKQAAEKYRKKQNIALNDNPDKQKITEMTTLTADLLKTMTAAEMRQSNAFRAMLFQPRITQFNLEPGQDPKEAATKIREAKVAYAKYKLPLVPLDRLPAEPKIVENLVPITSSEKILKMKEEQFLTIEHDIIPKQNDKYLNTFSIPKKFMIDGSEYDINIKIDNGIIDLPMLRHDAFYVLIHLLELLESRVKAGIDYSGTYDDIKTAPIIFRSGTRLGDPRWTGSGFGFRLTVKNFDEFENILKEILKEEIAMYTGTGLEHQKLFSYVKIQEEDSDDATFDIVLYPPKPF